MKKALAVLIFFILLFLASAFILKNWLEQNFAGIINDNSERRYNLSYQSLEINADFSGLKLDEVNIKPIDKEQKLILSGKASKILIKDIHWHDLIFDKRAVIERMVFQRPKINIYLNENELSQHSQEGMRFLLEDILERGNIKNFSIENGEMNIFNSDNKLLLAAVQSIDLNIDGLKTNQKLIDHLIPFHFRSLHFKCDDITSQLDSLSTMYCQSVEYLSDAQEITIGKLQLQHEKPLAEISRIRKIQTDVIDAGFKKIKLSNIASTNFADQLILYAGNMEVDSLYFTSFRDKNLPRPPDEIKPMFLSVIKAIPWQLSVDTMQIKGSKISYLELPENGNTPGILSFENFYASIYNFTTIEDHQQTKKRVEGDIICNINGSGKMKAKLIVPYNDNYFWLQASITDIDALKLNKTLNPLLSIDIMEMDWHTLHLQMHASKLSSKNEMTFEYEGLKLSVKDAQNQRKGFKSLLTNILVRTNNTAGKNNYLDASYQTIRNPYRGPFNLMWNSLKDGMLQIVPSKTAQKYVLKEKKEQHY